MDSTQLITADDLEMYAKRRDSEAVIPELLYRLVNETTGITSCRIPYGDAVNQPGWDGLVETDAGFRQFVPKNKSYWEIGTGAKPQVKATSDFTKRTKKLTSKEKNTAAYVFVTPSYTAWTLNKQKTWITKRNDRGWRELKIIDGCQLADWLREYPAIGYWFLKKADITRTIIGLRAPSEHWQNLENLSITGDPPLPSKLFLIGREMACEALTKLFKSEIQQLVLTVESDQDAEDFVSAFLASLEEKDRAAFTNRCLLIQDQETWQAVANLNTPQILVAHPSLDLELNGEQLHATAIRKGHSVILPTTVNISNPSATHHRLFSPSPSQIESILIEAKFPTQRARELSDLGSCRLASLKRNMRGLGDRPVYASTQNARELALSCLLGRWDGLNQNDINVMETILGKSYGEWIEVIRDESLRPDTPLTQHNNKWKVVSRGEAWSALGPRLCDTDLSNFIPVVVGVLGEQDPQVSLSPEERLTANLYGTVLKYSKSLRKGLAETLALMGSRPEPLSMCSGGNAVATADKCVRELLNNADWIMWASLDTVLPMLGEASPAAFLDSVESALLKKPRSPFLDLFKNESTSIFGRTYLSGLLWSLEIIAWSSDYLSRVTLILAELAEIDPGGQWTNRPSNTLVDIFLPWHPQTCSPIIKRKAVLKALLAEHPTVGWKLLMSLLPNSCSMTSGTCKPTWRSFIPRDWSEHVTDDEYVEQVRFFVDQSVDTATHDLSKMVELLTRISDLPKEAAVCLLDHIKSPTVADLPEDDRLPIWEALVDIAQRHRSLSHAKWALPPDALAKIDETAARIAPTSTILLHRRLFSSRDIELYSSCEESFSEREKRIEQARIDFVVSLCNEQGLEKVFDLAASVDSPDKLGSALGQSGISQADSIIIPSFMESIEEWKDTFTRAFVWSRFWKMGWKWIESFDIKTWPTSLQVAFFIRLPFTKETWLHAEKVIASETELYWKQVTVNPWRLKEDSEEAAEKLLVYGRPKAAIECLSALVHEKKTFKSLVAVQALLEYSPIVESPHQMTCHEISELIAWLQDQTDVDPSHLGQIEVKFIELFDHDHRGAPKTLEQRLADDPTFFAEIIKLCYKSDKGESDLESDESVKRLASISFKLLHSWKTIPGMNIKNKSFSSDSFRTWVDEAKRLTIESGHLHVALIQIGQVLSYSPADPNGLWIHKDIAKALNEKDVADMRHGYTIQRSNMRGAYWHTGGKEELKLAEDYRLKADALEQNGYPRFADSVRGLAKSYEADAKRQSEESLIPD